MPDRAFDPLRSLSTLNQHQVRYVLIGGFAARLWGSPTVTADVDICYASDEPNLIALAQALKALHASLRDVDLGLPFILDAQALAMGDHFTFDTDAGALDCLARPAGVDGHDQLARNAAVKNLGAGAQVRVAALEDIVRMKRASARPKDLIELEVLGRLIEELEQPG